MTLPHYLKELRLAIQEKWAKDPTTPKAEIEKYEATRKARAQGVRPLLSWADTKSSLSPQF
jgi:hypothetical protein